MVRVEKDDDLPVANPAAREVPIPSTEAEQAPDVEPAELCPPRFGEKSHYFGAYPSIEIADRLPKWVDIIEKHTGKGRSFIVPNVVYLKDGSRVINTEVASFPKYVAGERMDTIDKICDLLPEIASLGPRPLFIDHDTLSAEGVYGAIDIGFYNADVPSELRGSARVRLYKPHFYPKDRTKVRLASTLSPEVHQQLVQAFSA